MPHLHSKRALTAVLFLAASLGTASSAQTDITIGMQLEPPHLDPTSAAAGAIDNVVYSNIFEGLTRFMGDGSVVPGLAKSWDISDDGLRYTFHLQSDVRFHDGTAMDAEDVKFSLDRARAEDSTNAQKTLFAGIADVEVIDVLTGIMRVWYHIRTVFQVANIAASILGLVHSPLWYCAS